MSPLPTHRWQLGTLDHYDSPRWEALSPRDATALVAYTDGEASTACAIARDLPRAYERAADATYRRVLALWCAGAPTSDLHPASLAHVDVLAKGLHGAKPALFRHIHTCNLWCQAALLVLLTAPDAPTDATLFAASEALLARVSSSAEDEWCYSVKLVRAVLVGDSTPSMEGIRFSPKSPAEAIARRDPVALTEGIEADLVMLTRLLTRQRRSVEPETLSGRTTGYVQRGEMWLRTGWLTLGRRAGLNVDDAEASV
jgi:hypothetical protein